MFNIQTLPIIHAELILPCVVFTLIVEIVEIRGNMIRGENELSYS
jgi:hypothetical protein